VALSGKKKRIGELLVESGIITRDDFEQILVAQKGSNKRIGELVVEKGICSEYDIAAALSSQLGMPCIDLKTATVEPAAIEIISETLAHKHQIVPIYVRGRDLHVAMADPFSHDALEDVQFATGYRIQPYISTYSDIFWAIEKYYHKGDTSVDSLVSDIVPAQVEVLEEEKREGQPELGDLRKQSEAAPIIRMVNLIITRAVEEKASDIHIEPKKDKLIVRNRVDGALRVDMELPSSVQGAIISRLKIMSSMDIAERRVPQDGRIAVKLGSKTLDLRVSTLPTTFGEKVVIRILDSEGSLIGLEKLGLDGETRRKFVGLITKPQGIILVTGPTGSGKTTTLYTALSHIADVEKNVSTIEDPIEYELNGINQVGVDEKAGRTFENVLRSLLRQDPDVIMVGEMRDVTTATIAMQASLTGHLVFSTIHTNNTVATITRLRDLGVPSYLISSTIIGIIAQRLVRVICPFCKEEYQPHEDNLRGLALTPEQVRDHKFLRGKGCGKCGDTGYKGRAGIYEMLVLSQKIKEAIATEASEGKLRQIAIAEGMQTLPHAGVERLMQGVTTVEEVLRAIQTDEDFGSLCPDCGAILGSGFVACPECGKKLIETCPSCSKTLDAGWKFCPYCSDQLPGANQPQKASDPKVIRMGKERSA
jgi:type IV pilus assembly protein PilB